MTNLLHIDSSIWDATSHSRPVTAAFAEAWKAANPDGGYTYRDFAVDPVEHLTGLYMSAAYVPADQRSPEQAAEFDKFKWLRDEVIAADVVLLGVPMYNYTIPSTIKTWIDHLLVPELLVNAETGEGLLAGKKVFVATARGGSYAPGTPKESWDHQEPLLRQLFQGLGLDQDLTFIHSEMTLAYTIEHLKQFQHIADASKENAYKAVQELAAVA
ncbi:NAD(P)H-dependent oxidoreductase [Kibdelosporangium philippinense]|uniref:FMN dependent NADH:quinone oxidoreductase n=1 Tax=Kibdelosporangium philippinense TaxID=211113 RepID=A0ABS8ZH60_9PSEU|nr:NAD(P)H-dependent oxidoreductase [Kibdelosporangium philippinense]MCE7007139.1 NAD(P)H-dependent oxidoreductase [Kibdelosporangium philippinense]